jgi:hypothetical protein
MHMLTEGRRPSRGAFGPFDVAQFDDVLDQWLASLTPDQFERAFASLQGGSLCSLEPTA